MSDERAPVLIVGGGLSGLTTALFLAWRGIQPILVERHPGPSFHPRAHRVNERTMELMRAVPGLEDALVEAGPWAIEDFAMVIGATVTGPEFHRMNLAEEAEAVIDGGITPVRVSSAGQDQIEPVLLKFAKEHGADVRFGTELVSFRQDEEGVSAVVRDRTSGAETTVRADYLIAADGHRSTIREGLGIGTHGVGTLSHNINVTFESDALPRLMKGKEATLYYLRNPKFTGSYIGTHIPERGSVSFDYDPVKESPDGFDAQKCLQRVRAAFGVWNLEATIVETLPWEMASRVADRLRDGRIFIIGDAAHQMTPAGGLGGQTAMQDGYDLAWKLAAVLQNEAGPGLLDTYEEERAPVAEVTVARTVVNYLERLAPHRTDIPRDVKADNIGVTIGYRYRSRAILAEEPDDGLPTENPREPSGRPGTRGAHVVLERDGARLSTIDLSGAGFVLLAGPEGAAWTQAAGDLAAPLIAHRVGADLQDVEGRWQERYGVRPGGAVLLRPDGYIAWRSADAVAEPKAVLDGVLRRVLQRT
ncbi:FAD-dependent monooxygenase [Actinoallomurus sp. CA-150999]|uniref:FAD-dependent monooxygenase n=1 Tax=Actinoallomurus sp. CA-150999 TaxID=3239887 RepID=UPI003D8B613A